MKELSIEEKAKRYDEAVEKLRSLHDDYDTVSTLIDIKEELENIFPELKESEGERTWIINYLSNRILNSTIIAEKENLKKAIAWLEKQGESYTKMDVDDAYLKGVTNTKNEIEKQYEANYQIRKDIATFIFNYRGDIKDRAKWMDYLGIKVSFAEKQGEQTPADKVEPKFHEDDWIVNKGHSYLIADIDYEQRRYLFEIGGYTHEQLNWEYIANADNKYHLWTIQDAKDGDVLELDCGIGIFKDKCIDGYNIHCYCYYSNEGVLEINKDSLYDTYQSHPTTKEQRDQLEKAMTNAGYTFDFEKKELKKIEQKHTVEMKTPEESLGVDSDTYNKIVDECVYGEQNPTLSEEEIENCAREAEDLNCIILAKHIRQLKSLRPQSHWKPSEEQVMALANASETYCGIDKGVLYSLYNDLKKLREK